VSSNAHGNPADLRRFASELRRAGEQVRQLSRSLQRTLNALDWNDDVRRRIEADVKVATKGMEKFAERLSEEHARQVEKKAQDLETYLR
jgi:hypothetical protein